MQYIGRLLRLIVIELWEHGERLESIEARLKYEAGMG